jgi:hypothetical protein
MQHEIAATARRYDMAVVAPIELKLVDPSKPPVREV